MPVTPTPSQVCGWFHANFKGFRHNMLTAFNESAKRIGGPDWGKQVRVRLGLGPRSGLGLDCTTRVHLLWLRLLYLHYLLTWWQIVVILPHISPISPLYRSW